VTRPTLAPGSRVGPFIIDGLIGRGGMGDVYRALQPSLDRRVALKLLAGTLAEQDAFVARFLREARTMRVLEHPYAVTVYDAGEADGQLYLAMRLVTGTNLQQFMESSALDTGQALGLLRPLAEVIDYAHSRGIIHRDIKPANILIDDEGKPVLADFGLAKALDDTSVTLSSDYLGTPLYLAPEQATAGLSVGPPADVYAFGCVAFKLFTGTDPYTEQDSLGLLLAHGTKPVPHATERNAALPRAIDEVFARALAKTPTDRYPSARSFVADLDAAVASTSRSFTGRLRSIWPRHYLGRSRRATLTTTIALISFVAVVAVMGTTTWLYSPQVSKPTSTAAPVAVTRAPTSATVPRGSLLYSASMTGTSASFVDLVGRGPNTPQAQVLFKPGMLKLAVHALQADAGIDLKTDAVTDYIGDIDLSVQPGSNVQFCWGLRWAIPAKLAYALCMQTASEFVQLDVFDGTNYVPISPRETVPRLQTGRVVPITVVVRDTHLTLLIDGTQRRRRPPGAPCPDLPQPGRHQHFRHRCRRYSRT
jgi:serine/threonine protein kinase